MIICEEIRKAGGKSNDQARFMSVHGEIPIHSKSATYPFCSLRLGLKCGLHRSLLMQPIHFLFFQNNLSQLPNVPFSGSLLEVRWIQFQIFLTCHSHGPHLKVPSLFSFLKHFQSYCLTVIGLDLAAISLHVPSHVHTEV